MTDTTSATQTHLKVIGINKEGKLWTDFVKYYAQGFVSQKNVLVLFEILIWPFLLWVTHVIPLHFTPNLKCYVCYY